MQCEHLEPLIESIADGSYEPGGEDARTWRRARAVRIASSAGARD